jgi:hypothetical protein
VNSRPDSLSRKQILGVLVVSTVAAAVALTPHHAAPATNTPKPATSTHDLR